MQVDRFGWLKGLVACISQQYTTFLYAQVFSQGKCIFFGQQKHIFGMTHIKELIQCIVVKSNVCYIIFSKCNQKRGVIVLVRLDVIGQCCTHSKCVDVGGVAYMCIPNTNFSFPKASYLCLSNTCFNFIRSNKTVSNQNWGEGFLQNYGLQKSCQHFILNIYFCKRYTSFLIEFRSSNMYILNGQQQQYLYLQKFSMLKQIFSFRCCWVKFLKW
eukprot:TRINITY_DN24561_c0_g1_i3.p2 TRINITY_DN24561_c0_g1~~TRINITY_DN24561_c0_g1_i3.p2  ORF type:complete len:214 (-),score=-2.57 TRINITY_DN24561_c0_g1_i3:260-901(-)